MTDNAGCTHTSSVAVSVQTCIPDDYDLALIKTLSSGQSATVAPGANVSYTITIKNQGNVPSNDYTVKDQIPAGMSFVSASDGGTLIGSIVIWATLPNIAPGATKTLTLVLRVDDATKRPFRKLG